MRCIFVPRIFVYTSPPLNYNIQSSCIRQKKNYVTARARTSKGCEWKLLCPVSLHHMPQATVQKKGQIFARRAGHYPEIRIQDVPEQSEIPDSPTDSHTKHTHELYPLQNLRKL